MLFCLGDKNILKIILKHFPFAPLNGISSSNQSHNCLVRDKPHYIELTEYKNDIPLLYVIRDDHPDLLLILFKFKSFTFDYLTQEQKQQIFHLCLLAEHRRVIMDEDNLRWFKNQSLKSLSPCGSIECLRLIIEYAHFNPFHFISSRSPFELILKPIQIYLKHIFHEIRTDVDIGIPADILSSLFNLIKHQMKIFSYLITNCCLQPTENDLIILREFNSYIAEMFDIGTEHSLLEDLMRDINTLLEIDRNINGKYSMLKQICRFKIRNYVRNRQDVLVQIEKNFFLNSELNKYLKCLM
jgi:hypothetical protein